MAAEDERPVRLDIEDTTRALDQLGPVAELILDDVRQTGGSRQIVSLAAVGDADLHVAAPGLVTLPDDA